MKTLITKDICTPVFIPVLFTMAKNGSNLKKVRTDRWMDEEDVVYIHNGILHALQNLTIFKNNGGPGGYCAKTQNDKEWQRMTNAVWSLRSGIQETKQVNKNSSSETEL